MNSCDYTINIKIIITLDDILNVINEYLFECY